MSALAGSKSTSGPIAAAIAVIVLATLVAYHNSLSGALIFDDSSAITHNPSIRALWPLKDVLMPPAECTVAGRPLANLTFAINYAFGGVGVRGYHITNLLFHVLSALTLFGIVRRTLAFIPRGLVAAQQSSVELVNQSLFIARAVAGLWAVHPLLTESVSYISQRTEVLMSLCYLLTLYSFIRASESRRVWWIVSVAACFAGVASKEGMVTTPVLVLLYDRTFVSGSFRQAWQSHWKYYLSLAVSWLLLGFLMSGLTHRAVGFGLGVTWFKYALTECEAVLLYLRLIFWPNPLIFDYGAFFVQGPAKATILALAIAGLVVATVVALRRRPKTGFLFAAFLLILSPTSSVVPVATQPIAENRVYLASAAIVALAVLGLFVVAGRRTGWVWIFAAAALIAQSVERNKAYSDAISIWSDNVAKRPFAPRGLENLGEALYSAGRLEEARKHFEQAIRLEPGYSGAHHNLGTALHALGRRAEALQHFEIAVRQKPNFPAAQNNYGNALLTAGRLEEAARHLREAIRLYQEDHRLKPDLPEAHNSLGNALLFQGDLAEARKQYAEAIRLKPEFVQAQMNLGVTLRELGAYTEAARHLEKALELAPNFAEAHFNLGVTFARAGDAAKAVTRLKTAASLKPDFLQAHMVVGELLLGSGELQEAQAHAESALRLSPNDANARTLLEQIRSARTKSSEPAPKIP
jgi:protein O-mannosyl-transferase